MCDSSECCWLTGRDWAEARRWTQQHDFCWFSSLMQEAIETTLCPSVLLVLWLHNCWRPFGWIEADAAPHASRVSPPTGTGQECLMDPAPKERQSGSPGCCWLWFKASAERTEPSPKRNIWHLTFCAELNSSRQGIRRFALFHRMPAWIQSSCQVARGGLSERTVQTQPSFLMSCVTPWIWSSGFF